MELPLPFTAFALSAAALLPLTLAALRWRRPPQRPQPGDGEALDTVAAWPPEPVRALSVSERQGFELLRRAMPGFLVLSQVPLSRFLRVPTRHPQLEWLHRVGGLSADLLLCDSASRVLVAFDIRPAQQSERSVRRHERMARVMRAAGIRVQVWREGALPTASELRRQLGPLVGTAIAGGRQGPPHAKARVALPDLIQVLADGDRTAPVGALDGAIDAAEPVPSGFYDDWVEAGARP